MVRIRVRVSLLYNTNLPGKSLETYDHDERTNYPFNITVDDMTDGFLLTAMVQSPVDPVRVCLFMQTAVTGLIDAIEKANDTPLRCIDVLPKAERDTVLEGWNATKSDYPKDKCIHELFEAQAAKTPDAIAVVHEDQQTHLCGAKCESQPACPLFAGAWGEARCASSDLRRAQPRHDGGAARNPEGGRRLYAARPILSRRAARLYAEGQRARGSAYSK